MVRAILEGRKTQTRRILKPQPVASDVAPERLLDWKDASYTVDQALAKECPYGQPGDRLWVRETWAPIFYDGPIGRRGPGTLYRTNMTCEQGVQWSPEGVKWKPSIHMPRKASRITLEIVSVRVERVQDISEADCEAEGIDDGWLVKNRLAPPRRNAYAELFDEINGDYAWRNNFWVWVIEFKRVDA